MIFFGAESSEKHHEEIKISLFLGMHQNNLALLFKK